MYSANKHSAKTPRRDKTPLSSNSGSREKLGEPVQVYCRLRPLKDDKESTCIKVISPTILCLSTPSESRQARKDLHYEFKHIFTAHSDQKEVFDHVAFPLIDDLLSGKNGLLFTYGVTGSGKTYTLTGEPNNPGIMPRSIHTIFNSIQDFQAPKFVIKSDRMNGFEIQSESDALQDRLVEIKSTPRGNTLGRKGSGDAKIYSNDGVRVLGINQSSLYSVFINYIEIYNNTVYDLLDETSGKALQAKILREDSNKNMYVNGVVEVEVKSAAEAFEVFNAGQKRKRMGHTTLNAESSRSHSIFNIRVVQLEQFPFNGEQRPAIPEQNVIKVGQLSLVDLAGSERCSRTQNTGIRLKEASSINNSLMSLRNCLEILRKSQMTGTSCLVPYRDSRLTLFFKNYFEGQGRIEMIVCINPSVQDFEENLQVVKFAELSQDVKVAKSEVRYTPLRKVTKRQIPGTPSATPKKPKDVPSFSLPKIPSIKLNFEDPDSCTSEIMNLIKVLRMRKEKSKIVNKEIANKEQRFRKHLVEINQENMLTKSEIRSLKTILKKERQKVENLDTKIADLEMGNNNLVLKQRELEDVIRNLRNTIDEKNMKICKNKVEREKIKQKQALESEKMSQELEEKLRRQREHLQAEMLAKENKLKKMRELLESNLEVPPPHMEAEAAAQTQDEPKTPEKETVHRRSLYNSSFQKRRRSRSAGEVWLEHNAVKPVPLGTVLQPTMKKRKSITKLSKAKDVTNSKQNKYCLIAQETDSDGEIETKLYKADIVQTCGGGAQVIFNDVERLRQQSPTAD